MPQVYLRKEAYNRLIESGHAKDLEAFLAHAVELAVEELRQVPKSDPSPGPPMLTSTITEPAPTVTSDVITSKPRVVEKVLCRTTFKQNYRKLKGVAVIDSLDSGRCEDCGATSDLIRVRIKP